MIAALVLAAAIAIPPRPSDYVTDNAGALSANAAQQIRTELQSYEHSTNHHVIVWIGQTTGDTPLEDWTIRAAEQWKIGRNGVDDGVILFLFMRDRKVRIEVGYGLESALTDAQAGAIIRRTIIPKMRAGDVDGAVQGGVDRILVTIAPSFASQIGRPVSADSDNSTANGSSIAAFIFITAILFFVLIVIFASRKSRRGAWYWGGYSGGGGWSGGGGGGFSGSFGGGFGGGGASGGW